MRPRPSDGLVPEATAKQDVQLLPAKGFADDRCRAEDRFLLWGQPVKARQDNIVHVVRKRRSGGQANPRDLLQEQRVSLRPRQYAFGLRS